jgi:hypothetical protein
MSNHRNRFEEIETVEDYFKYKAGNDPTLLNITNQSMTSFRGSQFLKAQDQNNPGYAYPADGRSESTANQQYPGTFSRGKPPSKFKKNYLLKVSVHDHFHTIFFKKTII